MKSTVLVGYLLQFIYFSLFIHIFVRFFRVYHNVKSHSALTHCGFLYTVRQSLPLSAHMKLFSDTELKNSLYNLIAHPKDKTDVIGNAPRAFQIICMTLTDIFHKFLKAFKLLRFFQLAVCCAAEDAFSQAVFQLSFIRIMCCKISFVCFVMRKSKIISHIMHDLTESSPVYSGILFLRVLLDKRPHLILEVIECSENSCLVVRNDGFRSGMILPRQNAFLCCWRLYTSDIWSAKYLPNSICDFLRNFFPLPSFLIQILTGQQ